MSEPKRYKSAKECWLKFLSLTVSMKYHVWLASTIGMFIGLIVPWLWIAFSAAVIGVRGWEHFLLSAPQSVTEEHPSTAPEAME